jgi:hypothetical protein
MRTQRLKLSLAALLCWSATGTILHAAEPAPAAKPTRDDPNKVICRRETVTGSYAQTRKVCMTRAEWIERTRDAQAFGTDLQERGRINSCSAPITPGAC